MARGAWALLVAVVILFSLGMFMLTAAPVVDGVADSVKDADATGAMDERDNSQIDRVKFVSLTLVPTLVALGTIIYVYAAIVGEESHVGGRRY